MESDVNYDVGLCINPKSVFDIHMDDITKEVWWTILCIDITKQILWTMHCEKYNLEDKMPISL